MRKELKVYTGILVFALMCAAGWIVADSSLTWSDPNGQRGTFKLDGVIVTNSTFYGNCSGITNVNGANISQGNIAVARITNAAATVGPYIGGNIPVATVTNAAATVGPYIGGNIPVATVTNALTTGGPSIGGNIPVAAVTNAINGWTGISTNSMILFITNGIVKNSIAP